MEPRRSGASGALHIKRRYADVVATVSTRSMQVLQKPESARISPEILQRSLIEASITEGDPFELCSSLGYMCVETSVAAGVKLRH